MTEGWQPRRCATCGHANGEHRSAGSRFPHPPRYGVCLVAGCECQEFIDRAELEGGDRAAS